MKRLLCLLFAALLLCVSASALELPSELDGTVPRELIDSAEAGDDLLLRGGQYLFSHFRAALQDAVANSLRRMDTPMERASSTSTSSLRLSTQRTPFQRKRMERNTV